MELIISGVLFMTIGGWPYIMMKYLN